MFDADDPDQPRKYFDVQALTELKASIEKHGVLQPVLVRQGVVGALLLVSGERRYQVSKLAGSRDVRARSSTQTSLIFPTKLFAHSSRVNFNFDFSAC